MSHCVEKWTFKVVRFVCSFLVLKVLQLLSRGPGTGARRLRVHFKPRPIRKWPCPLQRAGTKEAVTRAPPAGQGVRVTNLCSSILSFTHSLFHAHMVAEACLAQGRFGVRTSQMMFVSGNLEEKEFSV